MTFVFAWPSCSGSWRRVRMFKPQGGGVKSSWPNRAMDPEAGRLLRGNAWCLLQDLHRMPPSKSNPENTHTHPCVVRVEDFMVTYNACKGLERAHLPGQLKAGFCDATFFKDILYWLFLFFFWESPCHPEWSKLQFRRSPQWGNQTWANYWPHFLSSWT